MAVRILRCIELIRRLTVAKGMLSHSSASACLSQGIVLGGGHVLELSYQECPRYAQWAIGLGYKLAMEEHSRDL